MRVKKTGSRLIQLAKNLVLIVSRPRLCEIRRNYVWTNISTNRTSGAELLNDSIGFGITTRVREIYNLHNTRLPLNPLFRIPHFGNERAAKGVVNRIITTALILWKKKIYTRVVRFNSNRKYCLITLFVFFFSLSHKSQCSFINKFSSVLFV